MTEIEDNKLYNSLSFHDKAEQGFIHATNILALANHVITDRLHAFIFSIQINKPHTIIDNSYGKVSSFYETWLKDSKITTLSKKFKKNVLYFAKRLAD